MRKPVRKLQKGLVATITDKIRAAIVDAEFQFGESLSEDNLAGAFDVSRTPVREALNQLQLEGLVRIIPKSGTYVFTPTVEEIVELCEYRAVLEEQAVRLIAKEQLAGAATGLREQVAAMKTAIAADDMRAYGRADTAYHLVFFRHCGNRYLRNGYELILGRVSSLRTHLAISTEGEPERSFQDHGEMIDLLARDSRSALAKMLKAHVLRTKDNYISAFELLGEVTRRGRSTQLRRRLAIGG
jgi:DNA-binding GntR family transcriptional regulator